VKQRLNVEKAGHLGTLDPIATGVFPVCLGKATRLTPFYLGAEKSNLAEIKFGFFKTTDDREGKQEGPFTRVRFNREQLDRVVGSFQGEFRQKPPIFSAKKIQGKRAYDLARQGIKPDLPLQTVTIHEIRLVHFEDNLAVIYIHCGTGTYVRSIARELGMRLRCGAHVNELTRSKFNDFTLEQCSSPGSPIEQMRQSFIPLPQMLSSYPALVVDELQRKRILNGSSIAVDSSYPSEWIKVFDQKKQLLAMAKVQAGERTELQPRIVFHENAV
jgi:tRNA pseudouridine55 synthase